MGTDVMSEWVLVIAVFTFVILLAVCTSYMTCKAKATALNYSYNYAPFQGCVMTTENGSRVLLEQLRSIDGLD